MVAKSVEIVDGADWDFSDEFGEPDADDKIELGVVVEETAEIDIFSAGRSDADLAKIRRTQKENTKRILASQKKEEW